MRADQLGEIAAAERTRVGVAVALAMIVAMLSSACAVLGPKTQGTAGAIQWHVRDLPQGNSLGSYPFTLVLTETRGVGMQITKIEWAVDQPRVGGIWGILACSHMTMVLYGDTPSCGPNWKGWRLDANDELRLPLQSSIAACTLCPSPPAVIPLWRVTVTGTDDHGQAVREIINIRLPAR